MEARHMPIMPIPFDPAPIEKGTELSTAHALSMSFAVGAAMALISLRFLRWRRG
jgi:hypothetical protein